MRLALFSSLALASLVLLATCRARPDPTFNPIRLASSDPRLDLTVLDCDSWRWAVETNNNRNWYNVPESCVAYVEHYMIGGAVPKYNTDIAQMIALVLDYLKQVNRTDNDIVIFDLSETLLSNIPYCERPDVQFGGQPWNQTAFEEWVQQGEMPAVPNMPGLFNTLVDEGWKTVILSGSAEKQRDIFETNLKKVGYKDWFLMTLKNEKTSTKVFKEEARSRLVEAGYNIVANIGDQWRDITGANAGLRTFKLPNPMYYSA